MSRAEFDWLLPLGTWASPAYPIGAFSYSHGLEWAVEAGRVTDVASLADYVATVIEAGAGWADLVLVGQSWRAAEAGNTDGFEEVRELAAALRGTAETALETMQQGASFVLATRAAWPGTKLDQLADDRPMAYPVAFGAAAAGLIPLNATLLGFAQAVAANLVSAGVRLVPLGQTDGQRALARLAPVLARTAARAEAATLHDIGTAAPMIDLFSMRHETQYTRLFRS
ncbi:urease accessory protein UreF [Aliidongia dinghuensis]|uniref:Urease accessory protein UreF n=1 Tax=Aliidongia dinghuensis TaxID=1867774 RepID=A0A8J2YUM2_9PROT|nr:urease accessory protein UreF [Aliidongia dinghuensis]GGF20702.1 urease accessory protein UreF [Aliidongia dinghuensis]